MTQQPPTLEPATTLWTVVEKIAEQGLLFAVLVGFIVGSYLRKIAWGWQIEDLKQQLAKHEAKMDAKVEVLEAESRRLIEIIATNTKTTGDAVAGFARAMDELERREHPNRWDGKDRRK